MNLHVMPSELLGRTQRNVTQLFREELPALAETGPVIHAILVDTLTELGRHYPACRELAADPALHAVASALDGTDGRQVRKFVADTLTQHVDTATDPAKLTVAAMADHAAHRDVMAGRAAA